MKYTVKIAVFVIVVLSIFLMAPMNVLADVGHNVGHSSSSHSSSSHSSSSGSSSHSSYSSYSSGSSSGGSPTFIVVSIVAVVIILVIVGAAKSKSKNRSNFNTSTDENTAIPFDRAADLTKLKEYDPNFSEPNFISKINTMFIMLQNAWTEKKWEKVRPLESDQLFNMHRMQLQEHITKKTTNVVENICILDTKIVEYRQDDQNDILDVLIKARINDYEIDDETKRVIKGDPNEEFYMTYIWTMTRRKGVLTNEAKSGVSSNHCPNCGASLSINQAGKCEYCDSIVTNGDYDWVLNEIRAIDQE